MVIVTITIRIRIPHMKLAQKEIAPHSRLAQLTIHLCLMRKHLSLCHVSHLLPIPPPPFVFGSSSSSPNCYSSFNPSPPCLDFLLPIIPHFTIPLPLIPFFFFLIPVISSTPLFHSAHVVHTKIKSDYYLFYQLHLQD